MTSARVAPKYLLRWDFSQSINIRHDVVTSHHRLDELSPFGETKIAELIDRYPRDAIEIETTGSNPAYPNERRRGRWRQLEGNQLLELIARGRLRLTLQDLQTHHKKLGHVIDRLWQELKECNPGLRRCDCRGQLLIGSPRIIEYFQYSTRPIVRWQINGSQRVWVYPRRFPFLSDRAIEDQIVGVSQQPAFYHPDFDQQAQVYDLAAGQMLALPQYTPLRVENQQELSISLQMDYLNRDVIGRNRIHQANRILRRYLPRHFRSDHGKGLRNAIKQGVAALAEYKTNLRSSATSQPATLAQLNESFCVDPDAIDCVGSFPVDSVEPAPHPVIPPLSTTPAIGAQAMEF